MTTTVKMRKLWARYRCIHTSAVAKGDARLWGRNRGATPLVCGPAWIALEETLITAGYRTPKRVGFVRRCPRGISGKPCKESGADCSLHNYGLAVDIDPFSFGNPHFQKRFGQGWDFSDCRVTRGQVEAVEAIETNSGVSVFRWLGWSIGDTMHFQVDCSEHDLGSGVRGMTGPVGSRGADSPEVEEEGLRLARRRDEGDHVATYMELLHRRGHTPDNSRNPDGTWDGKYGPGMAAAVAAFIADHGGAGAFPGEDADFIGPILRAALIDPS